MSMLIVHCVQVPEVGVTGDCELPNVGARNWTLVLCKTSRQAFLTAKPSLQISVLSLPNPNTNPKIGHWAGKANDKTNKHTHKQDQSCSHHWSGTIRLLQSSGEEKVP